MRRALIVGYGNTLRGDDAVGQTIAALLIEQPLPGVEVLSRHQLTPELAENLAAVDVVVFIDALAGAPPGAVGVTTVAARPRPPGVLGHHADPEALLSLCQDLYHRAPHGFLVSVGAASFELGAGLSDVVVEAIPEAIIAVCRLVTSDAPVQLRNEATIVPSGSNS